MKSAALAVLTLAALASTPALAGDNDKERDELKFDLIRAKGLVNFPTVAPNAHGRVKIESVGPVEIMKVTVWGLPPHSTGSITRASRSLTLASSVIPQDRLSE
jgi:hypothetical protein